MPLSLRRSVQRCALHERHVDVRGPNERPERQLEQAVAGEQPQGPHAPDERGQQARLGGEEAVAVAAAVAATAVAATAATATAATAAAAALVRQEPGRGCRVRRGQSHGRGRGQAGRAAAQAREHGQGSHAEAHRPESHTKQSRRGKGLQVRCVSC